MLSNLHPSFLSLLLLSRLSFTQDISISNELDGDSQIICYGDIFLHYMLTPSTAADFCTSVGKTKCGARYKTPNLLFDQLAATPYSKIDQLNRWKAFQSAIICNTKCECAIDFSKREEYIVRRLDHFPDFAAQDVFEWDFDLSQSTKLDRGEAEPVLNLYGSEISLRNERVNGDFVINLDVVVASKGFLGALNNKPICKPKLEFEIEDIKDVLNSFLPPYTLYNTSSEFCINTLFGGSKYGNLGGICLHDRSGQAELQYPEEFKYPSFTSSFYPQPISLRLASALKAIEAHCNSNCWCPSDEEKEAMLVKARVSRIDRMRAKFKKVGSRLIPFSLKKHERPSTESESNYEAEGSGSGTTQKTIEPPTCSNKDCDGHASCGSGCRCKVHQTVDPAHFDYKGFIAGCATTVLLRPQYKLGGRNTPSGDYCPCNATYISAACCESLDGMIWEPQEMKLGELRKRESAMGSE